jgi:hypothetical protein
VPLDDELTACAARVTLLRESAILRSTREKRGPPELLAYAILGGVGAGKHQPPARLTHYENQVDVDHLESVPVDVAAVNNRSAALREWHELAVRIRLGRDFDVDDSASVVGMAARG